MTQLSMQNFKFYFTASMEVPLLVLSKILSTTLHIIFIKEWFDQQPTDVKLEVEIESSNQLSRAF